jgi:predicted metal-dependent RNase
LHNIVYTGDLKYGRSRLFDPALTNFQRIETLIIESTYGGAEDIMPTREECEKQLLDIINATMERKGQVLIPSFAVGRAQEVMSILSESNFQYPIFIDGMIWDATAIHTAYPEYMSKEMEMKIFQGENPLLNNIFKQVKSAQEREKVWNEKPSVIISTSGMLMGGPAMEHLKVLGENKNNTLIFVGYQGEGTMGRRIQKGWKEIPLNIEGKTQTMKLELEVATIEGLSGHSDKNQLINYVHRLKSKPERIIVDHGDGIKPVNLARTLHKIFRIETLAPKNLEAIRLR